MRPYIVRQGDYVAKIATMLGCDEDEVWEDEKNQGLKEKGRTRDVFAPGDLLHVPDGTASPASLKLGAENDFQGEIPRVGVRIAFKLNGEPRANQRYAARYAGESILGTTDDGGLVTFEVPVMVHAVWVSFEEPAAEYQINVGFLDPATESSGILGRLRQLGYLPLDAVEDAVSEGVRRNALACFQRDQGLTPTGNFDEETRVKLESAFGS